MTGDRRFEPDGPSGALVYHDVGAGLRFVRFLLAGVALFLLLVLALNLASSQVPGNDKFALAPILLAIAALFVWIAWTVARSETTVTPTGVTVRTSLGTRRVLPRSEIVDLVPIRRPDGRSFVRLRLRSGRQVPLEGLIRRHGDDIEPDVHDLRVMLGMLPGRGAEADDVPGEAAPPGHGAARSDRVRFVVSLIGTIVLAVVIFAVVAFGEHPHRPGQAAIATAVFVVVSGALDVRLYRRAQEGARSSGDASGGPRPGP